MIKAGNNSEFAVLHEHRSLLFIALMKQHPGISWYSKDSDEGWFKAGMVLPSGCITYNFPERLMSLVESIGVAAKEEPKSDAAYSGNYVSRLLKEWITK